MSDELRSAVDTVLVDCLALVEGENVVVLTDPQRRSIATALTERARALGAEALLIEMSERETNGSEPPPAAAAAMLACDVLVAPTTKSVSHTAARLAATNKGVRAATMPRVTEDLLVRTMSADYAAVRARSATLARLLTDASSVHVTSAAGTDVTIDIEGREGIADDGDLTKPAAFGNLPAGEGFIAPVEGKTNGRIVFDGSIWPIGRLDAPLVVDVVDGYAANVVGERAREFMAIVEPHGHDALAIAELGIGTNDAAIITGNVLEDEKVLGTVHIAFGDNHSFGGRIRVSSHQDGVVLEPTVDIGGQRVLEGGRLLI